MAESAQEPCFCCGLPGKEGISIAGRFLCLDCEKMLSKTRPGDKNYEDLVERCKNLWTGKGKEDI